MGAAIARSGVAREELFVFPKVWVSNLDPMQLPDPCTFVDVAPMVNLVETHVFWQERPEHAVTGRLGVAHMAWCPFAEGANGFFTNPLLARIGEGHGK